MLNSRWLLFAAALFLFAASPLLAGDDLNKNYEMFRSIFAPKA